MIFYDNVDKALVKFIKNCIPSCNNILPFNPKLETTDLEKPCVTFYQYDENANSKLKNFNSKSHEDLNNGTIKITESPDKIDIKYQIDIWTETRRDLNLLTREWLTNNPTMYNVIPVLNDKDEVYLANMKRVGFNNLSGLNNDFRYSYQYAVTIPLPSVSVIKNKAVDGTEITKKEL